MAYAEILQIYNIKVPKSDMKWLRKKFRIYG